jgi:hypothetical protein
MIRTISVGLAASLFVVPVSTGMKPGIKIWQTSPSIHRENEGGEGPISLSLIGRYRSGTYRQSAAEIVSYDPTSQRAFVVNAHSGKVDVLDMRAPHEPTLAFSIDFSDLGPSANSVAVSNEVVAVAVEAKEKTDPGFVAFTDLQGNRLAVVQVGALPDALTFSPNGRYLLVANEGEPNDDYSIDPEGSVTIVDLREGVDKLDQKHVRTADFRAFNGKEAELREQGVRIFGPHASVAQDLEPEWIEVSKDSRTAYVCLQENNAIAVLDIASATVLKIWPLGFKDWSENGRWAGRGFDASDRDQGIRIRHWPVFGIFQPDSIKLFEVDNQTYLVTANEGDARDWGDWTEEARVSELKLDPNAFPDAADLQKDSNLGRLLVTTTLGFTEDCDGLKQPAHVKEHCTFQALYTFGGRSMSVWRVAQDQLELVFDTGSQIEETIAESYPNYFNADHQDRSRQLDARSTAKGPEPEGLEIGTVDGRTFAFLGLERVGGIMIYEITDPENTSFVHYINTRDFSIGENASADHTGSELGPEGLCFVPADQSPDPQGRALLLVGNEVSGTTAVYAIETAGN